MKASEICIGDWFKAIDYNSPFRITAIYDDVVQTQANYQSEIDGNWYSEAYIKDLVPIELTEEILVKNGFIEFHHPGTGATDEYSEWFFGGIRLSSGLKIGNTTTFQQVVMVRLLIFNMSTNCNICCG